MADDDRSFEELAFPNGQRLVGAGPAYDDDESDGEPISWAERVELQAVFAEVVGTPEEAERARKRRIRHDP